MLVKLLFHKQTARGMRVAEFETRCLCTGEIHELVTTDYVEARCGDTIDRVGFLGFSEVLRGGIVEKGDSVWVENEQIGTVIGFDDCHFPNHYNVLIGVNALITAADLPVGVEGRVRFFGARAGPTEDGDGDSIPVPDAVRTTEVAER